jgi:hypothetical protein
LCTKSTTLAFDSFKWFGMGNGSFWLPLVWWWCFKDLPNTNRWVHNIGTGRLLQTCLFYPEVYVLLNKLQRHLKYKIVYYASLGYNKHVLLLLLLVLLNRKYIWNKTIVWIDVDTHFVSSICIWYCRLISCLTAQYDTI